MIDIYDFKYRYRHKKNDKVIYNKKIFKKCPFDNNEIKVLDEVKEDFIGIEGIKQWWTWWELVPVNKFKNVIYWIKFYIWFNLRFKKL